MPVKVSIVEDNDRVRESLASLIEGARGFRCVGAHRSAEAALKLIPEEKPDVVLMDIHLPRLCGIDCVRKLKAIEPGLLVIMLTAYEDDDLIFQALKAGANGYLIKQTPPSKTLPAIQKANKGAAPMPANIAQKAIQPSIKPDRGVLPPKPWSPRRRECPALLPRGSMN